MALRFRQAGVNIDLSFLPTHTADPVPKSLFILQVIDDPVLRQAIEKQLDRIEHVHRFTRAVSVGNPREFLQAEKGDQEMAEACKRLIKNCIICWNISTWRAPRLTEPSKTLSISSMLPDTAACKSSTNYVYDFGGKNCSTCRRTRRISIRMKGFGII